MAEPIASATALIANARCRRTGRAAAKLTKMPHIVIETEISAPIEEAFDLARSIDAHQYSQTGHREKAVTGCTRGLIAQGESVTWEAVHFGFRQRLTSRIVVFDRPFHFRDTMVTCAFKRFDHDHFFCATSERSTIMKDVFDYTAPLGILGLVADVLFLRRYMTSLLRARNAALQQLVRTGDHVRFIKVG